MNSNRFVIIRVFISFSSGKQTSKEPLLLGGGGYSSPSTLHCAGETKYHKDSPKTFGPDIEDKKKPPRKLRSKVAPGRIPGAPPAKLASVGSVAWSGNRAIGKRCGVDSYTSSKKAGVYAVHAALNLGDATAGQVSSLGGARGVEAGGVGEVMFLLVLKSMVVVRSRA